MIARERMDGHGSPTAETKSVTLDRQAALDRRPARRFDPFAFCAAVAAFLAFWFAASGKNRPLDAGTLPTSFALAAAAIS
jgi:hypothetical protein